MLTWLNTRRRATWTSRKCLEWFFPRTCVRCGCYLKDERGGYTCRECRDAIPWIREPMCSSCGIPFHGVVTVPGPCPVCAEAPPAFGQCRSLFLYRKTGARIVHALKYEHGTWLQGEITALLREQPSWESWFRDGCLVPVPLHRMKENKRGYNQALVIARAIQAAYPGIPVVFPLKRVRRTPSQTFLSRKDRLRNLRGAFSCVDALPKGHRLILVDDVLTTGATLNAAASALTGCGAGHISAFTLAHG